MIANHSSMQFETDRCVLFPAGASLEVIIGVSIGVGVLVIATVTGVILWWQYKKEKAEREAKMTMPQGQPPPEVKVDATPPYYVPGQFPGQFPVQTQAPYAMPYQFPPMQPPPMQQIVKAEGQIPPASVGFVGQPSPTYTAPNPPIAREANGGLPLGYPEYHAPFYGPPIQGNHFAAGLLSEDPNSLPADAPPPPPKHHHKSHKNGKHHHHNHDEQPHAQQMDDIRSYALAQPEVVQQGLDDAPNYSDLLENNASPNWAA